MSAYKKKLIIELTNEEYEEIVTLANECNLSVKELIIYRLLGYIS